MSARIYSLSDARDRRDRAQRQAEARIIRQHYAGRTPPVPATLDEVMGWGGGV